MLRVALLVLALGACSAPEQPDQNQAPNQEQDINQDHSQDRDLDLSREAMREVMNEDGPSMQDPEATLPDMFADGSEDKKAKLSGKVLTKEEAEDLRSTVDGVQVELEVPTR